MISSQANFPKGARQAARLPISSVQRLLKVTAFTVSVYSCVYRPFLPFRSPAGETGEIVAPDKGIRAIGEKVTHGGRMSHAAHSSGLATLAPEVAVGNNSETCDCCVA